MNGTRSTQVMSNPSSPVGAQLTGTTSTNDDEDPHAVTTDVFTRYSVQSTITGSQLHPGHIVESGCLASISLPPLTYNLDEGSIPQDIITSGRLSSMQLEGILYASQTHQTILPSGSRRGFYIGDAAGVGKGRQIAGIILDNYSRGRTKHVWFSISPDLIVDAKRDIADIGCYIKVIEGCQQLDSERRAFGLPKEFKAGIIFSTYSTLVSSVRNGGGNGPLGPSQSRLDQLISWCGGKDFDGCLIFDECHKAKHFVPKKESSSTKVSLAVMMIQRLLLKARVIYCSATGVSDIVNMAYMERLGLWGEGCPFASFDHFYDTVRQKGLGVAEMLAMEMKASGIYVSRGLSYQDTEFSCEEYTLSKEQKTLYDTAAHVWHELRQSLTTAIQRTKTPPGRRWSAYWAGHQRFFRQLCQSLKVSGVVDEVTRLLATGEFSAVIGLQSTGEASLAQEYGENLKPGYRCDALVSLCKEIMIRFIENHFPVRIQGEEELDDAWSVQARKMLLEFAGDLELPPAPLDELIDRLGGSGVVAEMTGRRGRFVRDSQGKQFVYELRTTDSSLWATDCINVSERNAFMAGRKLVAIISDAASTGISLHAARTAVNQRRRVHITLELPWSADKAVQQLGRSHRSNQSSGPVYKLVTTELGGERRFGAAVARRLESLGALTRGDRRAASCADLSLFNLDTSYGRAGLAALCRAVLTGSRIPGVQPGDAPLLDAVLETMSFLQLNNLLRNCLENLGLLTKTGLTGELSVGDNLSVGTFFNRLLGLAVDWQQILFQYFLAAVQSVTHQARQEGRYSEGLVDLLAEEIRLVEPPRPVFSQFKVSTLPTQLVKLEADRGMSWDRVFAMYSTAGGKVDTEDKGASKKGPGFYLSRREVFRHRLILLAIPRQRADAGQKQRFTYRVVRPNTGVSQLNMEAVDLHGRYTLVTDLKKAEELWSEAFDRHGSSCIHGSGCTASSLCTVGRRRYSVDLICGSVLAFISILEAVSLRQGSRQTIAQTRQPALRVVRVALTTGGATTPGRRFVGLRFPENLLPAAERMIVQARSLADTKQGATAAKPSGVIMPTSSAAWTQELPGRVEEKLVRRAMTPPPKITQFFKVIQHPSLSSSSPDLTKSKPSKEPPAELPPNKPLSSKAIDPPARRSKRLSSTPLACEASESVKSVKSTTNTTVEEADEVKPPDAKRQWLASSSQKMSNSTVSGKSKLQSSLSNLFAKQRSQVSRCPICQTEFPQGCSNDDLNRHIDNCIIE